MRLWVGPRAGLDDVEKRKLENSLAPNGTNSQPSSPYPVAVPTEISGLIAEQYVQYVIKIGNAD
jgi:hypothetical protein